MDSLCGQGQGFFVSATNNPRQGRKWAVALLLVWFLRSSLVKPYYLVYCTTFYLLSGDLITLILSILTCSIQAHVESWVNEKACGNTHLISILLYWYCSLTSFPVSSGGRKITCNTILGEIDMIHNTIAFLMK